MNKFIITLGLLIPLLGNAQAPFICGKTFDILNTVASYKEPLVFRGREESGLYVSVLYNKETGAYTIVKTSKDGAFSCIVAAGTYPSGE